ncbi:MAG TPA: hypothetical protein VKU01_33475 [Bryobacteraceae bacterium]|nr:hypothetical protein [Bryobacteraceae bacterium]
MSTSAIPNDQLERILPTVNDLLSRMNKVFERLSLTTDSALVYELARGDRK